MIFLPWLMIVSGGAVAFGLFMYARDTYGCPDLKQRIARYIGILVIFIVIARFGMMVHESSQPIIQEWRVDQVQYQHPGRINRLVVNYHDVHGEIRPQYRQVDAPAELAQLLQLLVEDPEKRSVITIQPGERYRISRVEVWRNRFDPPEVHEF